MKRSIDLEDAAAAEAFGALAVGRRAHRKSRKAQSRLTTGQKQVLADIADSLIEMLRESGATNHRVSAGKVSFELRKRDNEEILSVRKLIPA